MARAPKKKVEAKSANGAADLRAKTPDELKDQLLELAMLRNHFDLSLELTRAGKNCSVERRAQNPVLARKRDG